MDQTEIKTKIFKVFTIALPILLVAVLAMLIVVAMNLSKDNDYLPVVGGNIDDNSTTTTTTEAQEDPDEPIEDPSSKGLSFVSKGDGTCALDGIGECKDSFIIVPAASPDGDIVVEIADNAFKNSNAIKGIELPSTVERIGAYAFYGSSIREITVTQSIKEIGNYALCGCKYLTAINVEGTNASYSSISGVLYNKDGTVLITYPAGKTDNFVNISRDVVKISNMAFYRCSNVKKVNYHGTSLSWTAIEIGAGNDVIDEAFIYCAGDSGK